MNEPERSTDGLVVEPGQYAGTVPLRSDYDTQQCSIARALEIVGERWTLLIVRDLFYGVHRFTDLHRHLGVPKAVLATRLESLAEAGLIVRSERAPGRSEYALTARGERLWPVLFALYAWGDEPVGAERKRRVFVHVTCGAELDERGACPGCAAAVPPAEIEVRPGPGLAAEPVPADPVGVALRAPHRLLTPLP
jgi:DNA-binding HxlR family transcriptional regulator